ncbi:MAG TPA: ABC transporter permease [Hydrogenophaga sp.]|uniref:ABC transporter permease n=1 Tax=Hydrogenophaga sp. TaxID=1904254 RepID=UPI0008D444AA|nr:ABC transporter permease subunit [Hydrogenophaga sp.]OGA79706.1 MAG: ABC transporter permease [Burkholderiales bacterium GWE1_65_30]OGA92637.1 MAG: ABC transporter permease [Burkholderiales bacterium GWF1_66_17]HAX22005.1 ABC transporter permease [Hydrogenophaga sp.]HBU21169.1 ABC transporter permease [Hydrogenophaga sp.]
MDHGQTIEVFDARVDDVLNWLRDNAGFVFDNTRAALDSFYGGINWLLATPNPYLVMAVFAGLGLWLVSWRFAVLAGAGLFFCSAMGLWPETMSTLALVIASTALGLVIGLPVGVWAGYHPKVDQLVEPLLDTLQTLPPYIYLLPAIALLGYGPATSLVATVLVAIAPALRLASLGIRMTPNEYIELGNASGISPLQMFFKIRLPFAVPSIMAGINQSLMMAFGMVVIAGIVGSGGLGQAIYEAVRTLDIAKSIDASIAIVILTMVLDRLTQSAGQQKTGATR